MLREVLDEYLLTYKKFSDRIKTLDKRIEEISKSESYAEKVGKPGCFLGVKTHTAMLLIVATGDFRSFWGLCRANIQAEKKNIATG